MHASARIEFIICEMLAEIEAGTWKPQKTYDFESRKETKRRIINAPTFRDRVFHHAFHRVVAPLIWKKFIYDSYGNIPGKGQHRAVKRLQHFLRAASSAGGQVQVLYGDVAKYYDSIDHEILMEIFGDTFRGEKLRHVAEALVEGYNGDTGVGIPKGAVTSGLLANMYLNELDHFIKEGLQAKFYLRFVDDFIIVDNDKNRLREYKREIEWFLDAKLRLRLNRKSQIRSISQGVDFVGYRVFTTHLLPRKRTIKAAKIRFKTLSWLFAHGEINLDDVKPRLMSFLGYCKHCKCQKSLASALRRLKLQRRTKANENSVSKN
jgi:retron-type reverse transcriptase